MPGEARDEVPPRTTGGSSSGTRRGYEEDHLNGFHGHVLAANGTDVDLTGGNFTLVVVVGVIALVAVAMAIRFRGEVLAAAEGTERMRAIGLAVQEGAAAYLARQFRTLGVFAVIAFLFLLVLPADDTAVRIGRSLFFLVGAGFSAAIGYLGMWLAVRANV